MDVLSETLINYQARKMRAQARKLCFRLIAVSVISQKVKWHFVPHCMSEQGRMGRNNRAFQMMVISHAEESIL